MINAIKNIGGVQEFKKHKTRFIKVINHKVSVKINEERNKELKDYLNRIEKALSEVGGMD